MIRFSFASRVLVVELPAREVRKHGERAIHARTRGIDSWSRRPIDLPARSRAIVCGLSTMTCDDLRRPLSSVDSTSRRSKGASRNTLVKGKNRNAGTSVDQSWLNNECGTRLIVREGQAVLHFRCSRSVARSSHSTALRSYGSSRRLRHCRRPTVEKPRGRLTGARICARGSRAARSSVLQ